MCDRCWVLNRFGRCQYFKQIPASHSTDGSCTCGHVFTERKLIGGKRFSGKFPKKKFQNYDPCLFVLIKLNLTFVEDIFYTVR